LFSLGVTHIVDPLLVRASPAEARALSNCYSEKRLRGPQVDRRTLIRNRL
jgi:hypothetical protein